MNAARRPLPAVDADTAPHWRALGEGQLLIQWCAACGTHQFYPRLMCLRCWGPVEWVAVSGRGTVYSFTVVHRPPAGFEERVPYAVVLVDLEEGVRIMGGLAGDPDQVVIGMPVEMGIEEAGEGVWLPRFVAR
jgi:uncharacterized OB-fold protein